MVNASSEYGIKIGPAARHEPVKAKENGGGSVEIGDAISKIHSVQQSGGGEAQYLVTLVGGHKVVRRSASEVKRIAPKLLALFLKSVEDSDDDEMDLLAPKPARVAPIVIDTTPEASNDESIKSVQAKGKAKAEQRPESPADVSSDVVVASSDQAQSVAYGESEADSSEPDNGGADFVIEGMEADSDEGLQAEDSDSDFEQDQDQRSRKQFASGVGDRKSSRAVPKKAVVVEFPNGNASDSSDGILAQILKQEAKAAAIAEEESEEEDDDSIVFTGERGGAEDQHTTLCNKCQQGPLNYLLPRFYTKSEARARKREMPGYRKRPDDDLEAGTDEEEEKLLSLGAWFQCGVCIGSFHFKCLGPAMKNDYLANAKAEHIAQFATEDEEMIIEGAAATSMLPKRPKIELDPARVFQIPKCPTCKKRGGRRCGICGVSGRKTEAAKAIQEVEIKSTSPEEAPGLMFRCSKCNRSTHYDCQPRTSGATYEEHVKGYFDHGECNECTTYDLDVDAILAWRQVEVVPEEEDEEEVSLAAIDVVKTKDEVTGKVFVMPSIKDPLAPAEYLVKWQGVSYRRLVWVSHAFLSSRSSFRLKNFLARGSLVSLDLAQDDIAEDGEDVDAIAAARMIGSSPLPDPDAETKVPLAWKTVDRILDVFYCSATPGKRIRHKDHRSLPPNPADSIKLVDSCYIKWGELAYQYSTFEKPPVAGEVGYEKYVAAYQIFLTSRLRSMRIPTLSKDQITQLNRPRHASQFVPLVKQPELGGTLMPFQLEGVNFLYFQWWKRTGCILADEMGLGKTVQIIALLSHLSVEEGARPFLVTVPNSTIGNWVREFAKWAPHLRVVPYMGDATSRKIIEQYELFDDSRRLLKTHVVLATYDTLEKNISVFKRIARWDCLVVDEGQRLKGGEGGKLFDAIGALNISHRILLSGTPLNNNLPELFNLLGFINPKEKVKFAELREAEITNEVVEKVRGLLKPYFLRRTKDLVLDLPPLTELVVEITMTQLQRQMYISILKRNVGALEGIYQKAPKGSKVKRKRAANWGNILMELRKLLGHPYLISPDVEPLNVTPVQSLENLIKASCKLEFLSLVLPKLQAQGHRVLMFSQFKITLNLIEDFLIGMGMRYLRLDGDTSQADRQRGIDAYQAKDSPFFCYLLSTRAGGVGINLTAADVVIMYDQDFNPHQDLQAIARAHRIGQVKPVRVFKLLVKGTCEEKIFTDGAKKLGLDHLIVQRIDAVEVEEDVANILEFGARAIFDEEESAKNAITYTSEDVDELLARTSDLSSSPRKASASTFAHAKIWEKVAGAPKELEVEEEAAGETAGNLKDFWADILEQNERVENAATARKEELIGRGKRTRKTVAYAEKQAILEIDTNDTNKSVGHVSTDDDASGSDAGFVEPKGVDSSSDDEEATDAEPDNFLQDQEREKAAAGGTPTVKRPRGRPPGPKSVPAPAPNSLQDQEREKVVAAGGIPTVKRPRGRPPGTKLLPAPSPTTKHAPAQPQPRSEVRQSPPPPSAIATPALPTHLGPIETRASPAAAPRRRSKRNLSPGGVEAKEETKRRKQTCVDMMAATSHYQLPHLRDLLIRAAATSSASTATKHISDATEVLRQHLATIGEAAAASTSK